MQHEPLLSPPRNYAIDAPLRRCEDHWLGFHCEVSQPPGPGIGQAGGLWAAKRRRGLWLTHLQPGAAGRATRNWRDRGNGGGGGRIEG
jgi:hypothetical protein